MSQDRTTPIPPNELPGTGVRFSIGGMLIFTAVVAVHVALARIDLGLVVFLAPFSLSVVAIEILRRMFRMSIVRAMVTGVLLCAFCYALVIGVIPAWEYWFRETYTDYTGRVVTPNPKLRIMLRIGMRVAMGALVWYVFAGMLVMVAYCALILLRGGQAKRVVRSRLTQRDEAVDAASIEIDLDK